MIAKVHRVERINNSVYGNPNWELGLEEIATGDYFRLRTSANISQSYGINNDGGMVGKTYDFTLTKANRIAMWNEVN